jgi:hypothetical protein
VSPYIHIYRALTDGGMPATAAATVLAELRAEDGADLAAGLRDWAAETYPAESTDSGAIHRRKKAKFGATISAADWIVRTTAHHPTMPTQRTRSSS